MSKNEMISMIETMNNYDDLAAKAKAKADAIREAIKEEMIRQDTEELIAGAYIVRFTSVISNRFDSTTFKRLYGDLYKTLQSPSVPAASLFPADRKPLALRNMRVGKESSYKACNTNIESQHLCGCEAGTANKRT